MCFFSMPNAASMARSTSVLPRVAAAAGTTYKCIGVLRHTLSQEVARHGRESVNCACSIDPLREREENRDRHRVRVCLLCRAYHRFTVCVREREDEEEAGDGCGEEEQQLGRDAGGARGRSPGRRIRLQDLRRSGPPTSTAASSTPCCCEHTPSSPRPRSRPPIHHT